MACVFFFYHIVFFVVTLAPVRRNINAQICISFIFTNFKHIFEFNEVRSKPLLEGAFWGIGIASVACSSFGSVLIFTAGLKAGASKFFSGAPTTSCWNFDRGSASSSSSGSILIFRWFTEDLGLVERRSCRGLLRNFGDHRNQ